MTLAIISHPVCQLHEAGEMHPERPDRIKVIESALATYPFHVAKQNYIAPRVHKDQLLAVHDASYIDSIFAKAPTENLVSLDPDTHMNEYTLEAALRAAGSVPFAVDLVMRNEAKVAFCNVRPPGHHAERDKAMGFCFFNNVAVGAMHAIRSYNLGRILIIDFDVHHGNGTQSIFQHDARVMYCSSFEYPFYPGYDPNLDNEHIIGVPLESGTDSIVFREKVAAAWFDRIKAFEPQLVFFSAGFDGHAKDLMANLRLQKEDYAWITNRIANFAREFCQGRMVSVLEGGYSLSALEECVPAHVNAMAQI